MPILDAVVVKALHTENDKCSQPIQSGRCLAYFPRYAYDSQQGKCVNFIYGGMCCSFPQKKEKKDIHDFL